MFKFNDKCKIGGGTLSNRRKQKGSNEAAPTNPSGHHISRDISKGSENINHSVVALCPIKQARGSR